MFKYIACLILCMTLPVFHAQAQVVPTPAAPQQIAMDPTRLDGITRTLQAYPDQVESILHYYVGIDTTKIDIPKFTELVKRNDYQEIYNQVSVLSTNRDAFNSGAFKEVSYFKPEPVIIPKVTPPSPAIPMAVSAVAKETTVLLVASGVTAGIASLGSGGGGGSSGGGSNQGNTNDIFDRKDIADVADPASFVDAEFNAYHLGALAKDNAQYAYAKGLTGLGVKIGFYDFFTDDSSTDNELSSRIIYRNLNIAADTASLAPECAQFPIPEACNHGGAVMAYAANARDGTGTQGVAYQATLLMNTVHGTTGTMDVQVLADQSPDIINFSCTGCATSANLHYVADKGILMTAATGNSGGANPNSASPAFFASQLDYSLIAVTGVYEVSGTLTNGYDKCGTQQEYCLTAYSDIGTSFASPQVAGAAALIKQGWSFLTPKQISQILLMSAKDIGAPGVDPVYGHGLLDLQAAVEPIGATSSINGQGAVANFAPSAISQNQASAFGDAFKNSANAKGDVVIVDSFGRDFKVKAQDNLAVAKTQTLSPSTMRLLGKTNDFHKVVMNDKFSLQFSQQEKDDGHKDVSSFATYNVTPATSYGVGFATDMNNIVQDDTMGFNKSLFIGNDVFKNGFLNLSDNNQILYQRLEIASDENVKTKLSTYYSKQNHDSDYFEGTDNQVRGDYTSTMLETIVTPTDKATFNFKNGMTHETNSLLGAKFSGSFDMGGGASTYFSGMDVSYDVMPDVNLSASYTLGMTSVKLPSQSSFNNVSNLTSDSFFVTATKRNIFGHDSFGLSLGQPTRVRSGKASGLTQSVDPNSGAISIVGFEQNLVPTGQTILFQAAYDKALSDKINMNFAFEYSNQPYQQRDALSESAALVKMVYKFN